jgi:sugar/nucleoside kinase (ribokinase family)
MKVICIGSSTKDIFFPTEEGIILETPEDLTSQRKIAFELGAKFHIDKRYESIGGCAANVCCGLKKIGVNSSCYTTVGDDAVGRWIMDEFKSNGVDTELVSIENDCSSNLSAIVVDKKTGERIIFTNQHASPRMKISIEIIGRPEWIFIGDLTGKWEENLDKIFEIATESGTRIAFNPRQKTIHDNPQKVIEAIKKSKIILLNKDESIEVVSNMAINPSTDNLNDEKYLIKKIKSLGPDYIALTDGKRGAWAFDGEKMIHAGILAQEAVETTGAGDAFSSGFLGALIKGKNLEESIRWGSANSGNSVRFYGAIKGLISEKEIIEQAGKINVENL